MSEIIKRMSRLLGVHIPEPKVLERNVTPGKEGVTIGTDERIMQYHETGFSGNPLRPMFDEPYFDSRGRKVCAFCGQMPMHDNHERVGHYFVPLMKSEATQVSYREERAVNLFKLFAPRTPPPHVIVSGPANEILMEVYKSCLTRELMK